jgi:hypothetical protein
MEKIHREDEKPKFILIQKWILVVVGITVILMFSFNLIANVVIIKEHIKDTSIHFQDGEKQTIVDHLNRKDLHLDTDAKTDMASRITAIESNLDNMSDNQKEIKHQLEEIKKMLMDQKRY